MASGIYNVAKTQWLKKSVDMVNDSLKCSLLTSSASFTASNTQWSDISANEISGAGYSTGGTALATKTATQDNSGNRGVFDAEDVTWVSASFTARYAAIYDDTTATKYLIALIDFGGDQTVSSGDFKIQWSASGILAIV